MDSGTFYLALCVAAGLLFAGVLVLSLVRDEPRDRRFPLQWR